MSASETSIEGMVGPELARSMDALMSGAIAPLVARAGTLRGAQPSGRRFIILHLDGVGRDTLSHAIRTGYAPFLGRLLRSPSYRFSPCLSGAPASTPAFQAGLLYGVREPDIPGFSWYDRRRRREVRMDRAEDAAAVEAVLQRASPGLLQDGSANFCIFPGGAELNGYTKAGWAADRIRFAPRLDPWHLAAASIAHSLTAARIAGRALSEAASAVWDAARQAAHVGRLQHEPTFFLHRMGLAVGAREFAIWGALMDMARGVPAIYTCFGDYDEIAHRRGPLDRRSLEALFGIDSAVAHIFAAAASVPQHAYDVYVVTDHGQVRTQPFESATGLMLADWLALALPSPDGNPQVPRELAAKLSRLRAVHRAADALPATLQRRVQAGALEAARAMAHRRRDATAVALLDEVVCIEAGDIAHLYLGKEARPLLAEEIERRYPRLLEVLSRCSAVGVLAARGGRAGVVWWRGRKLDLGDPEATRELSLGYAAREAVALVRQMLRIPSAGDLVAYGNGLAQDVAFAWEFGSHAGIAREEVETYVIHPARARYDFSAVRHGADLHDFFATQYRSGRRDGASPPTLH